MFVIHRSKGRIVKGTHHVYTIDEAEDEGLLWVHWRHGREGDWVCSDDGYVFECLAVREYVDNRRSKVSRYDVYTIFFYYGFSRVSSWQNGFKASYRFKGMNTLDGKSWSERFVGSKKGRQFVKLVAAMMLEKTMDLMVLGEFLGFDKRYPDSTLIMVKRYMRNDLIENSIFLQMAQFLKDKGITTESVIEDYKMVKDRAMKDGKYGDVIKILEKFERWTGVEAQIKGDRIEHHPGEDIVGARIAKMLQAKSQPKELIGGGHGIKVSPSIDAQIFDGDGKRVEYVEVDVTDNNND